MFTVPPSYWIEDAFFGDAIMKFSIKYYFIGLSLSLCLLVGCTASFPTALLPDSGDGTPYQHDSKHRLAESPGVWEKTKALLAPDLDENGSTNRSIPRQQLAQRQRPSESRQNETNESSVLLNPSAYAMQSRGTGFDPQRQYSLYSAYSAFQFGNPMQASQPDYHTVARQEHGFEADDSSGDSTLEQVAGQNVGQIAGQSGKTDLKKAPRDLFAEASQGGTTKSEEKDSTEDIETMLQARSGDSRQFKQLLLDIRRAPEEDWKIDKEELGIRLANFRNSMKAEKDSELESLYLENLRNSILSNSENLVAKKTGTSRSKESKQQSNRDKEFDDRFADLDDESDEEDGSRKPLRLASKKFKASRLPDASEQSNLARSAPQPPRSKYGQLNQINDTNIMPVGYQASPHQQMSSSGAVVPANYQYPMANGMQGGMMPGMDPNSHSKMYSSGNWGTQARIAADMLRREIEQTPAGRTFENEVRLRLLELATGNRSEAVRPFTTEEKSFSEAWSNLALGVSTLYDNAVIPDRRERIINSAFRFDEASLGMSKFCPIRLRNVQFVKDWQAFGVFLERGEDCRAGEEVGVYMELENPSIRTTAQGFNVSASIRYEILDKSANVVEKSDKIPVEETTPSQKRDYCIHLPIFLPKSLAPGQYQLRINVTDMNSEKLQYAEEQIPLRIQPRMNSAAQSNR